MSTKAPSSCHPYLPSYAENIVTYLSYKVIKELIWALTVTDMAHSYPEAIEIILYNSIESDLMSFSITFVHYSLPADPSYTYFYIWVFIPFDRLLLNLNPLPQNSHDAFSGMLNYVS